MTPGNPAAFWCIWSECSLSGALQSLRARHFPQELEDTKNWAKWEWILDFNLSGGTRFYMKNSIFFCNYLICNWAPVAAIFLRYQLNLKGANRVNVVHWHKHQSLHFQCNKLYMHLQSSLLHLNSGPEIEMKRLLWKQINKHEARGLPVFLESYLTEFMEISPSLSWPLFRPSSIYLYSLNLESSKSFSQFSFQHKHTHAHAHAHTHTHTHSLPDKNDFHLHLCIATRYK